LRLAPSLSSSTSYLFLYSHSTHLDLHSFRTRRSSDLAIGKYYNNNSIGYYLYGAGLHGNSAPTVSSAAAAICVGGNSKRIKSGLDRKSTRLNSSHVSISYAVFCLKKTNTVRS